MLHKFGVYTKINNKCSPKNLTDNSTILTKLDNIKRKSKLSKLIPKNSNIRNQIVFLNSVEINRNTATMKIYK